LSSGGPPLSFDPHTPNPARIHDYLLGGHDNYDADRRVADQIKKVAPAAEMAASSRLFAGRAVTWAALQHGITQFADIGSGLPSGQAVHRLARAADPSSTIAYVDSDPLVTRSAQRILHPLDGGIAFLHADLRDPETVLADPALAKVIDLDDPVMILLTLVLQFMTAEQAREAVAGYARLLAPGSVIAISVPSIADPAAFTRVQELWPGELHNHTRAEIASFLDGLDLVPPGLVLARGWRGDMPQADVPPRSRKAYVLAAAAWRRLAVRLGRRGGRGWKPNRAGRRSPGHLDYHIALDRDLRHASGLVSLRGQRDRHRCVLSAGRRFAAPWRSRGRLPLFRVRPRKGGAPLAAAAGSWLAVPRHVPSLRGPA
jgi:SAM-dependent methyltransferase